LPAWTAAIVSLSLIAASYLAEVVRAGVQSVPRIQTESGLVTGLTRVQIFSSIVLPQALRNMIPALIATLVMMFKTTSLIYVVGITDLFRAVILINNREFHGRALHHAGRQLFRVLLAALVDCAPARSGLRARPLITPAQAAGAKS